MQPILHINLTTSKISQISIPEEWERDYLGGASLAARILYNELTLALDPLSPEAPLLFLVGPLSGTAGPAVGRFVVCAKSPATGLWGESNCGGFWGPELRMAGYDGLWLIGKAENPVFIVINDGNVEIRSAENIWGLETYSTQNEVKYLLGFKNPRVAVIGPAGEKRIPFSFILTDHGRAAGRTGMGAVMGSKNLKAIAIKGSNKVPLNKTDIYSTLRSKANRELKEDSYTSVMHSLGSAGAADYFDYLSEMPKKYFQQGFYEGAVNITGAKIEETILVGTTACHACVIACGRVVDLGDGVRRKGPEYETMVGFGANLLFDDPIKITRFGELCDRYGMDTISLSNIIGLVFKLFEMGKIPNLDIEGISLNWSNPDAIEKLIQATIDQKGIGEWVAKGARELAKHYKMEEEAVQVNGLEVPYHDPRGATGIALVYATSPRGACHNQSDYFIIDIGQVLDDIGIKALDPHGGAEKALNVAIHQNWRTIFNTLVMCIFANVPPKTVLELTNAACGLDWSLEELLLCGERGWNLKRIINYRMGLRSINDKLPEALLIPYQDNPPGVGSFVPAYQEMLEAYYEARHWDPASGFPRDEKLKELGLEWVRDDL